MIDDQKLFVGAWLDGIGTILSAVAEVRALAGLDEINNRLVMIGEGLQAVGTLLIGTVSTDDPLNFTGNWIDGVGAATSSIGAYLQEIDEITEVDGIRIEVLGNALQSMGASISSVADHLAGEIEYAIGNALQGFGAGLEAIGGVLLLKERKKGQLLMTIGAIIQAMGSNYNAIIVSKDVLDHIS